MIRVAAGEKLPFTQAEIPRDGWAIECRINAEDPFRGFLPSTGRLVRYLPPPQTMEAAMPVPDGGGVRVDTGVYEGGEIPMYYDSMIAKLIVHGARPRRRDRARCARRSTRFVIRGVASNIPFQAALLAHPKFVAGDFNTGFIAEHYAAAASAPRTCRTTTPTSWSRWPRRPTARYLERAARHQRPACRARASDRQRLRRRASRASGASTRTCRCAIDGRRRYDGGGRRTRTTRSPTTGSFGGIRVTRHLQRPAVHRAGRAPRPVATASTHNGLRIEAQVMSRARRRAAALMPFKAPPDM